MPAISTAIGAEPKLQRAMSSHAVRFMNSKFVEQIMLKIFSIICSRFAMKYAIGPRFAAQALHMQRGLMISDAPTHVELELASNTFIVTV